MRRTDLLREIQQMLFSGLLDRHERAEPSQREAAEMLGSRAHKTSTNGRLTNGYLTMAIWQWPPSNFSRIYTTLTEVTATNAINLAHQRQAQIQETSRIHQSRTVW